MEAYKAKKAREAHLVEVETPPAPAAGTAVTPTSTEAPTTAPTVAPVATPLAVPTNAGVSMEVEHLVPPSVPQLDIAAASMMIANEEKLTDLEISDEVNGFFTEST